jgi:hypothetical protein
VGSGNDAAGDEAAPIGEKPSLFYFFVLPEKTFRTSGRMTDFSHAAVLGMPCIEREQS